jgi:hypothetical protein
MFYILQLLLLLPNLYHHHLPHDDLNGVYGV